MVSNSLTLALQAFALCLIVYTVGRAQYRLLMALGEFIVRRVFKVNPKDLE